MNKHIRDIIDHIFDFTIKKEYLFRELYGMTFVFRRDFIHINDEMSSGEIFPVGIIYEENDEYYYAPLYEIDEIDDIIQEFVKTI